jgi:hypothetical protein
LRFYGFERTIHFFFLLMLFTYTMGRAEFAVTGKKYRLLFFKAVSVQFVVFLVVTGCSFVAGYGRF